MQASIPTALQALMVLKQQANPVAPGPGGQPIPTVAAQTAQQMMPPPMQAVAQNAATGANIQAMQQQNAQKALMDQMLAQQQAKAQQPVLVAEGGIASLDVGGMDDYAEGGVVGFAVGGIPVGEATETGKIWSEEAKRWLKELLERQQATEAGKTAAPKVAEAVESSPSKLRTVLQGLKNLGSSGVRSAFSLPGAAVVGVGSLLSNRAAEQMQQSPELREAYENPMLGAMDPNGALAAAILSQPTTPGPDQTLRERLGLGNEANRKVLEEIEQIEQNRRPPAQPSAASVTAAPPIYGTNTTPTISSADQESLQIMIAERNRRMVDAANGDPRASTDVAAINREIARVAQGRPLVSNGAAPTTMPSSTSVSPVSRAAGPAAAQNAEPQLPRFAAAAQDVASVFPAISDAAMRNEQRGLQALQAQRATPDEAVAQLEATRERQREIYQRQLARQGNLGELMSVLGSISRRGDGLTGLEEYRTARDTAALAQVMLDQNLANEKRLLREKYLADQVNDKAASLKFEEALYKNAEERQKLLAQTSASAFSAQAGMFNAQTAADQREQAALLRALTAEQKLGQGAQAKPVDRATILERYADNWEKLDPMQKNDLKAQGIKTFDDYVQYRDRLLGGGQAAPAVGTVMQGYRFKGGNPADQNNWEKV